MTHSTTLNSERRGSLRCVALSRNLKAHRCKTSQLHGIMCRKPIGRLTNNRRPCPLRNGCSEARPFPPPPSPPAPPDVGECVPQRGWRADGSSSAARCRHRAAVWTRETLAAEPQGRSCGLMGNSALCERQEHNGVNVYVSVCLKRNTHTRALFVVPPSRQADLR